MARISGGRCASSLSALLALGACYAHHPDAHRIEAPGEAPEVRRHPFVGVVEGRVRGRALLVEVRRRGSFERLELELELGATRLELSARRAGEGLRFERRLSLGGVIRRWRGWATPDRLVLELLEGPGAPATRDVPWGPSSVLDLGHPLAWGLWLSGQVPPAVRVVRLLPLAPGGVAVDRFELERRGVDEEGRARLWVTTRAGPVALWVTPEGRPARVRLRLAGPGSPRVEWRPAGGD